MKILVVSQDYPSVKSPYAQSYVHSRSIEYVRAGHDVRVLSFSCTAPYSYEGIDVMPASKIDLSGYDVIASHAPNLRNHMRFLGGLSGHRIAFFWHGHEVLRTRDYPAPYSWARRPVHDALKGLYDEFKLPAMRMLLRRLAMRNSVRFVFVSDTMKRFFANSLGQASLDIARLAVIPNGCHPRFLQSSYSPRTDVRNVVTIRPLDNRKYAVDLVVDLARANQDRAFHVYGKGDFFRHIAKPANLTHHDEFIPQSEMPALLDRFAAAAMPTRYDAQGVMACEMATYGIPLLTTDVDIAREMVGPFSNVDCVSDDRFGQPYDFGAIPAGPDPRHRARFDQARLARQELEFFDA